jgi:hypothetical protein
MRKEKKRKGKSKKKMSRANKKEGSPSGVKKRRKEERARF